MFFERLFMLIKNKGITIKKFCEDTQINKNSPAYWRDNNTMPKMSILKNIANYFNVSVEYLKGETDDPTTDSIDFAKIGAFIPTKQRLKMLGNIACGEPIFADEDFDGYIELEDGIKADFCLRAKGDSMIGARIYDGDIVFIKSQSMVENGEIAVALIGDEATLKRVMYYPDKNMLILKPENTNYQDIVLIGEELNTVRILGKAVAFQSLVR
jgi:repressor LexA